MTQIVNYGTKCGQSKQFVKMTSGIDPFLEDLTEMAERVFYSEDGLRNSSN